MKHGTMSLLHPVWLLELFWILTAIELMEGQIPPNFTDPTAPYTKYVKDGRKLYLSCNATGEPGPARYSWRRNGSDILNNPNISTNPQTGDLNITVVRAADQGEYQCVATITMEVPGRVDVIAVAVSPIITVKLLQYEFSGDDEKKNREIMNIDQYDFTTLSLPCEHYLDSQLVVKVWNSHWYIGNNQETIKREPRRYIDNKGTLHIIWLTILDSHPNDPYRCGIRFPDTLRLLKKNIVNVTRKGIVETKPILLYATDSNETKFQLHEDAELECVFGGYSEGEPLIHWELDDLPIKISGSKSKYNITEHNRKLVIKNVTELDEWNYTCIATNGIGETRVYVELDVISPPIFDSMEKKVDYKVVIESQNVTFNCDARSLQGEEEVGEPILLINAHQYMEESHILKTNKSVTVLNTKKSRDFLCVQCNVSNNYGTTWTNGCLRVIIGTKVSRSPPKLQFIQFGDDVDLTTEWTIDPGIDVTATWTFNGIIYPYREFPFSETEDGRLFVDTTTLEEDEYRSLEGTYILTLSNPYQSVEISTNVTVHPFHPKATFGIALPVLVIFIVISPLVFIFIVVSWIIIQKLIYKRGQRAVDYWYDDNSSKPDDNKKDGDVKSTGVLSIFNISRMFTTGTASRKTETTKKSSSSPGVLDESKKVSSDSGAQPSGGLSPLPLTAMPQIAIYETAL